MAEAGKVMSKVLQETTTQDLMVCVTQRDPGETQTGNYQFRPRWFGTRLSGYKRIRIRLYKKYKYK